MPSIHTASAGSADRYARTIEASRRVRWEIERDVIRGRRFDITRKFLPDGLALSGEFGFLNAADRRFVSQIQGRTYAAMFGLVERFIGTKLIEIGRSHGLGDQVAMEALVRLVDEELKHQALFRQLEWMMDKAMPAGYRFAADPNGVADAVLSKSTWSVLGLTLCIELMSQAHYLQSIQPEAGLDALWKDVFLFHWKEEAQHAVLDELQWKREDAKLDAAARDAAVEDLIALVGAVDATVQAQAGADAEYFAKACGREVSAAEAEKVREGLVRAYRWQYIVSGVQVPHFSAVLGGLITGAQHERIATALAPLFEAVGTDRRQAA